MLKGEPLRSRCHAQHHHATIVGSDQAVWAGEADRVNHAAADRREHAAGGWEGDVG